MLRKFIISVIQSMLFITTCFAIQDGDENLKFKLLLSDSKNQSKSSLDRKHSIDSAYFIALNTLNDTLRINRLLDISIAFYGMGNFDSFLDTNRKVLLLVSQYKDSLKIARCHKNFGNYYRENGQNDSAYYYLYEANKIYERLKKNSLEGKTMLSMAIVQKNVKDYVGSEVTTIRALKRFEGTEEYYYFFSAYNNLGIISNELRRYEDAIKYHQKAFEYASKIGKKTRSQVISLNNLGLTYEKKEEYEKAIVYYQKALGYNEVLDQNPGFYAIILDNIAYSKFRSGDYSELPELFYKPLKICDNINNVSGKIFTRLHLAEYYGSLDSLDKSKKYALEVKALAKGSDYNRDLLKAMLLLSRVSEGEEALSNAQSYIKLNDSLQQQERATRDQFARIRFETDILEEEKEKVTKEKEMLTFAIGGILLLSMLIFVIFKQQQRNKELIFAQEQQKANEEIYRLMLSQQVKLEEGRQMEKRRVSEELHDGVLGRLFGTRLGLDGLNQRIEDDQAPKRGEYILELASIEKEIRRISHDLSSNTFISEVAFVEVVEQLISKHCEIHRIGYEFENHPAIIWEEIKDAVKINIYRIIQEALQNIAKHSQAKNVEIRFDVIADQIKITILDDGIGFKKYNVKKGIGLKNISSRVREIKGSVEFANNDGPGAKVVVTMAMPE